MRCSRASSLLSRLLALSLLSSCFLAGYDEHARDDMDAGEAGIEPDAAPRTDASDGAPEHDAEVEAGAKDASAVDARADGATHDADTHDADTRDADTRDADTRDAADANHDARVEVDASMPNDAGPPSDADTSVGIVDGGPDATVGADAGDAGPVNIDGGGTLPDAGVGDAGGDACGTSGCVVTQTCTGSECDLVCSEPPDPGNDVTLDCRFDCTGSNRCASVCSASNTCQTNCTSTNICRSSCPYSAVCFNNCTNVADCGGTCNTGSSCVFNCTGSTCNQITCALGAACRVRCNAGSTCDFAYCGNLLASSCSDGSIVCGRLCP
jgi:hypothetical protein